MYILIIVVTLFLAVILAIIIARALKRRQYTGGEDKQPDLEQLTEHYIKVREKLAEFDPSLKNKHLIQLHYADWCGYCEKMKEPWKQATQQLPTDKFIIAAINRDGCRVPGIALIPTIVLATTDNKVSVYSGPKSAESIVSWITDITKNIN